MDGKIPDVFGPEFSEIYKVLRFLGKGAFGKVIHCLLRETGEDCAVKFFRKTEVDRDELMEEVEILSRLDHPHIVKYRTVRENQNFIFIEMELLEGGSLGKLMKTKRFSELEAAQIMKQILSGLAYIHEKNIVHRDIKPDNILFVCDRQQEAKIIDFGLSASLEQQRELSYLEDQCGTVVYMAPEQAQNKRYSKLVDIWSTAMIMYTLIAGHHPIQTPDDSVQTYIQKLLEVQTWTYPPQFSPLAQSLFQHIAEPMALQRYSAEQSLMHPWISRNLDARIPLTYMEKLRNYNNAIRLQAILKIVHFAAVVFYKSTDLRLNTTYKDFVRQRSGIVLQDVLEASCESPEAKARSAQIMGEERKVVVPIMAEQTTPTPKSGAEKGKVRTGTGATPKRSQASKTQTIAARKTLMHSVSSEQVASPVVRRSLPNTGRSAPFTKHSLTEARLSTIPEPKSAVGPRTAATAGKRSRIKKKTAPGSRLSDTNTNARQRVFASAINPPQTSSSKRL